MEFGNRYRILERVGITWRCACRVTLGRIRNVIDIIVNGPRGDSHDRSGTIQICRNVGSEGLNRPPLIVVLEIGHRA